MKIDVEVAERAFVLLDGRPVRYLSPGRHRVFAPFSKVAVEKLSTERLLVELDHERLALVPSEDLLVLSLASHERVVVYKRGKPVRWLGPGVHQLWTVERSIDRATSAVTPLVRVEKLDVSAVETRPLPDELRALAPANDYLEVTAAEGTVALRFIDGSLDAQLPAGRHAAWTVLKKVIFSVIDLRERVLHITGQEVMTRDRVTLRLNVSAVFQVDDARRVATVARAPDDLLYLAVQLAARELVAAKTLDELLNSRDEIGRALTEAVASRVAALGLKLTSLGLKDVILPGEIRDLLNKVIAAQKEAEANVIFRREETAATRSMAQTAKVLSENPLLVRLKELEAYKELAAKVGQVHLVLGESGLPKLELKT